MNNNNNIPNFEHFLRDSVEDFRMLPARKIWFGIYNQVHPSKKWPSFVVSFLILVAIMFVGVSNNNNINSHAQKKVVAVPNNKNKAPKQLLAANYDATKNNNAVTHTSIKANTEKAIKNNIQVINTAAINTNELVNQNSNIITSATLNNILFKNTNKESVSNIPVLNNFESNDIINESNSTENEIFAFSKNNRTNRVNNINNIAVVKEEEGLTELKNISTKIEIIETDVSIKNIKTEKEETISNKENNIITEKDLAEKNSYSTKNKTTLGKLKEKGSLQYYLTPSMGYRLMTNLRNTNFLINQQPIVGSAYLKDIAALNLELGAVLQYKIRKNIATKVGIQLNYTNYVSMVEDLGHTVQTFVASNNSFTAYNNAVSSYTTKAGNDRLNKTTWQIALPIGADISLLGNDKIKWQIGATLQPTYVLGGNAMVLSADAKNYVSEKSLLRKFNTNAAIETFVTIKTAKGIMLSVGPQIRYQLFSTYKNKYNYSEKLYNLGIKIGVVTGF